MILARNLSPFDAASWFWKDASQKQLWPVESPIFERAEKQRRHLFLQVPFECR